MPPPFFKKSATAKRKAAKVKRPPQVPLLHPRWLPPSGVCRLQGHADDEGDGDPRRSHHPPPQKPATARSFQRAVRTAIIRARFMGLLPYVNREE